MGLIQETNAQYYAGQEILQSAGLPGEEFYFDFDTVLKLGAFNSYDPANPDYALNNFKVYTSPTAIGPFEGVGSTWTEYIGGYTMEGNTLIAAPGPIPVGYIGIQLKQEALWNNYGGYQYVTLEDVINNFMMMYIGKDKIISQAPRGDVIFHAKRGLQEFSFDTLRSIKSQEVTVPDSLSVIIPQDYVNYVELSWIDMAGVKHIIYPTDLTINPYETPIQDGTPEGVPIQDHWGENLEGTSLTEERWDSQRKDFTIEPILDPLGLGNNWYRYWDVRLLGQRYGLLPEYAQRNGWFTIDDRKGKLSFSSVLHKKLITIEYISDGLAYDQDTKIPKMAETALYMHMLHGILSSRANVPEYTIQRFKKERRAALRNAKIRLSNIKLDEFVQVMRGKSKWIKY
tara:strand:+ start:3425 stop:4621 length:1197 start_codon:yes stop_codon:yes gene_type:complete